MSDNFLEIMDGDNIREALRKKFTVTLGKLGDNLYELEDKKGNSSGSLDRAGMTQLLRDLKATDIDGNDGGDWLIGKVDNLPDESIEIAVDPVQWRQVDD